MSLFQTRYGPAVVRVLSAYPPNSKQLYIALEALIMTAMENTKAEGKDELAMAVCEGLHPGVGKGLVCKLCHEIVLSGKMPMDDEDEAEDKSGSSEREEIARQVRAIIGSAD